MRFINFLALARLIQATMLTRLLLLKRCLLFTVIRRRIVCRWLKISRGPYCWAVSLSKKLCISTWYAWRLIVTGMRNLRLFPRLKKSKPLSLNSSASKLNLPHSFSINSQLKTFTPLSNNNGQGISLNSLTAPCLCHLKLWDFLRYLCRARKSKFLRMVFQCSKI